MKKNLYLLLMIFLLSGCSVEYNLEFNDTTFKENIRIGPFDSNKVEGWEFFTPYAIANDAVQEYYEVDYSNQELTLNHNYSLSLYKMSNTLEKCYDLVNISTKDNYYNILTSNEFKCLTYDGYTSDSVKINFKTSHKVISTNADYVDDNTYTWNIDKNNNNNKPIKIKLEKVKNKVETTEENQKEKKNSFSIAEFAILAGVLLTIIAIGLIYIGIKSKKRDEI